MPTDSNGVYSLPAGYLAVTGETVLASQHNPPLEDIAAALTSRLTTSGAAPMTGPIKLSDGTVVAPALTLASATSWGFYKTATGWGVAISGANAGEFTPLALVLPNGLTVAKTTTLKDGGDVASAGALTLGDGNIFNITGVTAITSIATKGVGTIVELRFAGVLTITHHATDLITTTGSNITTRAGAWARFEEYATGDWRMLSYQSPVLPAPPPAGLFTNLSIKVATNTTVAVAANDIVLTDGTDFVHTGAFAATCDLGANEAANRLDTGSIAAGTWYSIWAIGTGPGGSFATLASLSATSPTMPSGYTYKTRVGWVQTASGSAQLLGTWQFGRRAQYVVGLAQTSARQRAVSTTAQIGTIGSAASLVAFQVTGNGKVAPTTASVVFGAAMINDGASTTLALGTNNAYAGQTSTTNPPPVIMSAHAFGTSMSQQFSFVLESANLHWATSAASTGAAVFVDGWEDNI